MLKADSFTPFCEPRHDAVGHLLRVVWVAFGVLQSRKAYRLGHESEPVLT